MRSGPGVKELATGVAIGVRVDIHLGGKVIALDVPAGKVSLEVQGDRPVPERLTYELPREFIPRYPHDVANCFGQRSHVTVLQETRQGVRSTYLGQFVHGSKEASGWKETADGVEVTAFGLLQLAADNPFALPSSPERGATLRSELERLSGMPVVLDNLKDFTIPSTLQWGYDRLAALTDLCKSYGLEHAVRTSGYLHVWQPWSRREDARYTYRDILVDAPRQGLPRAPNVITVVGSAGGENSPQHVATVTSQDPPFHPSTYGYITRRVELSGSVTQAQVEAAAQQEKLNIQLATHVRSIEIIPDPRIELGDVVAGETSAEELGETIIGPVRAYSAVFEPESSMRVDVEVS